MDFKQVEPLLDKYWAGETTLAEETVLKQFFQFGNVPPHLLQYRELFLDEDEEINPELGAAFNQQIRAKLVQKTKKKPRVWLRIAAIGLVLIGLSVVAFQTTLAPVELTAEDTYSDPKEALEETKKAFALISTNWEKGETQANSLRNFDRTQQKIIIEPSLTNR